VSIIINLASVLIIAVTTGASLLYVLKLPHLGGRQKLTVLALVALAGVPVGFVLFVLLNPPETPTLVRSKYPVHPVHPVYPGKISALLSRLATRESAPCQKENVRW